MPPPYFSLRTIPSPHRPRPRYIGHTDLGCGSLAQKKKSVGRVAQGKSLGRALSYFFPFCRVPIESAPDVDGCRPSHVVYLRPRPRHRPGRRTVWRRLSKRTKGEGIVERVDGGVTSRPAGLPLSFHHWIAWTGRQRAHIRLHRPRASRAAGLFATPRHADSVFLFFFSYDPIMRAYARNPYTSPMSLKWQRPGQGRQALHVGSALKHRSSRFEFR